MVLWLFGCVDPPDVVIEPAAPTTTDALVATVVNEDPAKQYSIHWLRDGRRVHRGPNLPAELTRKGEKWEVVVKAHEGSWWSKTREDVRIQNTPPTGSIAMVHPEVVTPGDTVRCTAAQFEDIDDDEVNGLYTWTVNGFPVDGRQATLSGFSVGDTIACAVTPHDGDAPGKPVASTMVTVLEGKPQAVKPRRAKPEIDFTFAVIGDFGLDGPGEAEVAHMIVDEWEPDIILTVGDNNYPSGRAYTMDRNVGKHYRTYIYPYEGKYKIREKDIVEENRFFPCMGNHDWYVGHSRNYTAYFNLPGNERYYDFRRGAVHFFCVDSDEHEPDGNAPGSLQARWLQQVMEASDAPFKVVYFHHPPYSSGGHQNNDWMQWPFAQWGADLLLGGHDHNYERMRPVERITVQETDDDGTLVDKERDVRIPLIITGNGGKNLRKMGRRRHPSSVIAETRVFGAVRGEVGPEWMTLQSVGVDGSIVDQISVHHEGYGRKRATLVKPGTPWLWTNRFPGEDWYAIGHGDQAWQVGFAPLGHGGDEQTRVDGKEMWLRRTFEAKSKPKALRIEMQRYDGAALYLNGHHLTTLGMPARKVLPKWRGEPVVTWAPGTLVRTGTNVLAVHAAAGGDKLLFDVEISAYR